MVKFLTSSALAAVLVFAMTVQAQSSAPFNISAYPKVNQVPPITSPEVQAWLKEIDLTGVPTTPLNKGEPPACPSPEKQLADECNWVCQGCKSTDIDACKAPNTWGLTFDDGPSTATPTLLDFLKPAKISATFFLIGSNVIQYPDTVKRELAEGHHLASHTWSHHALTTLSNEQIVAEMKWTEKAVLEATGLRLKYMRPPYGDINNRVRFVLHKLGYIPVDWTGDEFDTNDWQMPDTMNEAQVIAHFSKSLDDYVAGNTTQGFYCLEHDLNALTVGAAQKLIPLGLAKKINIKSVAECESDAQPYQAGGTAPMPSVSGVTPSTTGAATATGTGATSTPSTPAKSGAAVGQSSSMALGLAAVAFAGAMLV